MKFEITEKYDPPSSRVHMAAVRDLVTASLVGREDPEAVSVSRLIRMAESPRGEHYSWTTLADLKYFLSPEPVRALRLELGRRTVAAFEQTSRANLESIGQIRAMVQ